MKRGRWTDYCGTPMRSRIEAGFASHLDRENRRRFSRGATQFTWAYEPRNFANMDGQYLPDFLVELDGGLAFVEVKQTNVEALGMHRRMRIILDTHPDAELWTATPRGLTLDDYRPEKCSWQLTRVRTERTPDLAASLARSGFDWTRHPSLWEHDVLTADTEGGPIAIIDAVHAGGPWKYTLGQVLEQDWARQAAEYKAAHPGTWVMAAAHGADASYVPLVELQTDRTVSDTYLSQHFTHNDLDWLMSSIGAS